MDLEEIMREPVLEVSLPRAAALTDLRALSRPLNLHLIYLFGYQASRETRTHWIKEVAIWLIDVASITIKPNRKRLSEQDYYNCLFDERFDSVEDVTVAIAVSN